ncbi:MAG: hypothetical protein IJK98_12710, partial [Clostridia bacterium]|nr:hypothetical protein [Clostridia bacterium]
MKREFRLRCIFILPILILLIYFGAALSNVVPAGKTDEIINRDAAGLRLPQGDTYASFGAQAAFDEPEWIDFSVCRMMYEELSDAGKTAYRALYDAVLDHKETVYIPALSSGELSDVHAALKYDNPQLPCISNEFSYGTFGALCYVKMQYDYSKAECDALSAELIRCAGTICEGCASLGDYEKEL